MDKIRELLSRLTELNADELTELRSLIVAEADRLDKEETTVENVAALNKILEYGQQVLDEANSREAAQAEAEAAKQEAKAKIAALKGEPPEEDPEAEATEEPEAEEPETPEAEAEDAEAVEEEPAEAVTATGGTIRRMAAAGRKPTPSPESQPQRAPAALTAGGALERYISGPIDDREKFAEGLAKLLHSLSRDSAPRGNVLVASARYQYPEERRLGSDMWENSRKMDAVTSPDALVATGGICAPTNVDYTVPTWATADRPLRDALPSFEATRGGLRYVQPPDLGGLAGATGIWTEATDANPAGATKPIISIQCGTEEQVYLEAIVTRLGFGNMQSRFAPEQIAANTDLAMAAAARVAENNLLNLIAGVCVQNVTAPPATTGLGATRDLITMLRQAVAAYKNAHRLQQTQTLTAIFPIWLRQLIGIDLARELAHEQNSAWNSLMVTDDQVDEAIRSTGVNPVYHLDGQPSSVSGGVAQTFSIQTGSAPIMTFPSKLVFYFFPEGQIQLLDGGRLDLGVVRDSTLDATNDYETFVEVWESIAFRGFANGAIQYVATLNATGESTGSALAPPAA